MTNFTFQYYGLDWLDAISSAFGIYFLARKKKIGFILNAVGAVGGLIMFVIISSYPFIILNIVLIIINLNGYIKWNKSN